MLSKFFGSFPKKTVQEKPGVSVKNREFEAVLKESEASLEKLSQSNRALEAALRHLPDIGPLTQRNTP